jgi:hypothetical protein
MLLTGLMACSPSLEQDLANAVGGVVDALIPVEFTILTGRVRDAEGEPLEGVNVAVSLRQQTFDTLTDTDGDFELTLPGENLPNNFLVLLTRDDLLPQGLNVNYDDETILIVNTNLVPATSDFYVVGEVDALTHLGNDEYTGSINSQFQKSTDGIHYQTSFNLTPAQASANDVELRLLAKGLQRDNPLIVNDQRIGFLNQSATSGAFSETVFPIPNALLATNNTLQIESHYDGSDYDDFEFARIVLVFNCSDVPILSGQARDRQGNPLADVNVVVPLGQRTLNTRTDTTGVFDLALPAGELPTNFLVLLTRDDLLPQGFNVNTGGNECVTLPEVNARLEPATTRFLVIGGADTLLHLGDDAFQGSINSQFQKSTDGIMFEDTFTLTPEQRDAENVELRLLAKGLQEPNPISVNGQEIGVLNQSDTTGQFSELTFTVPTSVLTANNTLQISSFYDVSGDDYDDFEFARLVLAFQ